jgi:hypothetical protein
MPSPKGQKAKTAVRTRMQSQAVATAINQAFTDLRADFELGSDGLDQSKLRELRELNVDTGTLRRLEEAAPRSSGVVSGLRGSGKSHLLLLAQDGINSQVDTRSLAVYINLKRLRPVARAQDPELLERMFILLLASSVRREVYRLLNQAGNEPGLLKLLSNWKEKRQVGAQVETACALIERLEAIVREGEEALRVLGESERQIDRASESQVARKRSAQAKSRSKANLTSIELEAELQASESLEEAQKWSEANKEHLKQLTYISVSQVRTLLVQVIQALGLRSLVFFFDEWSKVPKDGQQALAALIDSSLIDDPIFVWLAVVTHDYTLGVLELGADLPQHIPLDRQLVFEKEKALCKQFFSQFIIKRLNYHTGFDDWNLDDFIIDPAFERLVMASMGNTRDFGVMLGHAWTLFDRQMTARRRGGQPWYIGLTHADQAIQHLGQIKLSNLDGPGITPYAKRLWNELKGYAQEKGHTHFCVANTPEEKEAMDQPEMVFLLKHRLVLVRDEEISDKTSGVAKTQTLCALDFSCLMFDRNSPVSSKAKKDEDEGAASTSRKRTRTAPLPMVFVVDWETVHNRVRRYSISVQEIIGRFRVEQGEQHICFHCGAPIRKTQKFAWENKFCPSCGKNPFEKPSESAQ